MGLINVHEEKSSKAGSLLKGQRGLGRPGKGAHEHLLIATGGGTMGVRVRTGLKRNKGENRGEIKAQKGVFTQKKATKKN